VVRGHLDSIDSHMALRAGNHGAAAGHNFCAPSLQHGIAHCVCESGAASAALAFMEYEHSSSPSVRTRLAYAWRSVRVRLRLSASLSNKGAAGLTRLGYRHWSASAVTRLIRSLLYGVTASDPVTFVSLLHCSSAWFCWRVWCRRGRHARRSIVALHYE